MKVLSFVSTVFFGWMCYKHFNDPNMVYWLLLYGSMMGCSLFTISYRPGKNYLVLPLAIGGAALIGILLHLQEHQLLLSKGGLFDLYDSPGGKERRELLGMSSVILASMYEMAHIYINSRSRSDNSD